MNILITAGGTTEKIDQVRAITNHSTGRLGKQIATAFLAAKHTVTYVTTAHALQPEKNANLNLLFIETTKDLDTTLRRLFETQTFDAVIHSMAVSDFTTETAVSEDLFIEKLAAKLSQHKGSNDLAELTENLYSSLDEIGQSLKPEKKIPSGTDRLLLFLKKNPKIIAMIREQQPQTILVGFKLLVGVSNQELHRVGSAILKQNACDFVLANDLERIHGDQHYGMLINQAGTIKEAQTKREIAQLIVKSVEKKGG